MEQHAAIPDFRPAGLQAGKAFLAIAHKRKCDTLVLAMSNISVIDGSRSLMKCDQQFKTALEGTPDNAASHNVNLLQVAVLAGIVLLTFYAVWEIRLLDSKKMLLLDFHCFAVPRR